MSQRERIKVVCRIRPENKIEKEGAYQKCVTYDDYSISVTCNADSKVSDMAGTHTFAFDRTFGPDVRQIDVFEEVAKPVVDGILNGYNGTIFCYGQTGSGKTFTMEGPDIYHEELKGLLPRMFHYLFKQIESADPDIEFNIKVSFLEIYMEKIQDLLDPKKSNLQVKEDKGRGIYVNDCTEIYVTNPEEMFEVMRAGSKNRSVAATRMNDKSSRSHSIFILTLYQKNTKTETAKLGKLYFCDLAGSEKVGKTNASGQTLEEAKMINKSLSALGNVINALTESKGGSHIPYRDSKLTRILQESLGGNSQTCLVITCSLSAYNDRETLSTLRFGNRAKNIKNKVVQNAERSAKELLIQLSQVEGRLEKITDLVKLIQQRLQKLLKEAPPDVQQAYESFKVEVDGISSVQDLDYLYAKLNGEGGELIMQAIEEEEQKEKQEEQASKIEMNHQKTKSDTLSFIMPVSQDPIVEDNKAQITSKEQKTKIYKQHIEIVRLNEELEKAQEEKRELENEIKQRNEEIYQMNEKLILLEINSSMNIGGDHKQIHDLQNKLDKITDNNFRRAHDLQKLKQSLERLRCDLHVLLLGKKLNKESLEQISESAITNGDEVTAVQEQSTDSEKMVLDQIQSTVEFITRLENNLQSDLIGVDDIFSPDQENNRERRLSGRNSPTKHHARTRSHTIGQGKMDTTIMSEIEYINFLPDIEKLDMDDSSFLKGSFVDRNAGNKKIESLDNSKLEENAKVQVSATQQVHDEQLNKIEELKSIIESQKKQINDLHSQNDELKRNNLKSAPTNLTDDNEKEKEILALKEALTREQNQKERMILDQQTKFKEEKEQMERLLDQNVDKRQLYDLEVRTRLLQDKNKTLLYEVTHLRKDIDVKDTQLEEAQKKAVQLEKKLVLQQRQINESKILNKMPMASNLVMPFQTNGHLQFSSYGDFVTGQLPPTPQLQTQGSYNQQDDIPLFFNRKVIKPVKGGGKVPAINPYGNSKTAQQPINFNNFQKQLTGGKQKQPSQQVPILIGNINAPIIKPDQQKEFQKNMSNKQTPQQIKQLQLKQEEELRKAKKMIYYQKYKEAKEMTQQQINEESLQDYSSDSDGDDDSNDNEDEENEQEVSDMRREQSNSNKSNKNVKEKKSIAKKFTSAFKNLF